MSVHSRRVERIADKADHFLAIHRDQQFGLLVRHKGLIQLTQKARVQSRQEKTTKWFSVQLHDVVDQLFFLDINTSVNKHG